MQDLQAYRRAAIKYWEWRRVFYNAALVLPALLGYSMQLTLNHVGDPPQHHYSAVVTAFFWLALAASICYSPAYALEFLFANEDPLSLWRSFGRHAVFILGVLFAMYVALGGMECAMIECDYAMNQRR